MLESSQGSVSIRQRMSFLPAITSWLKRNRTAVRMAFVLRMIGMGLGSLFSMLWYRLLLRAMGDPLYGLFQNFQAVTRLGGLGDLGLSGALALKAGLMLGSGDKPGLQRLLASARSLLLLLAVGIAVVFVGMSPWLSQGLNFAGTPGAGSMKWLFLCGGFCLMTTIIGTYFASLNYAHGTVTWPILPAVLFAQMLAPLAHWQLALLHTPLWLQYAPYLVSAVIIAALNWRMVKWSHPWLGNLTPFRIERAQWKILAGASWWVYLVMVGSTIYVTTDQLVIGAVISNAIVPMYRANYKVCELGITLVLTAAGVSIPKITQWISSPQESDRRRLLVELHRLSIFEVVLACVITLGYLAFNNLFIRVWLGKAYQAPLLWQFAFAANLAITCGGNAGIQLATRAGDRGLKIAGVAALGTGLLNLGLSILSAKLGWIAGVAIATDIAQSISSIYLGYVTCRYLGLSMIRWTARCWLLPVAFTLAAAVLKGWLPTDSLAHLGALSACYAGLFLVVCRLAGMTWELLRTEINLARGLLLRS